MRLYLNRIGLLLGGGALLAAAGFISETAVTPEIRLARAVNLDVSPEQLMDAEVGPFNRFCLVDGGKGEVRCYSASGHTLWRAGRKGDGPGEYRGVYRIGVSPQGSVFTFDIARMAVTQYDSLGNLIRSGNLPFFLRQAGDLVVTTDSSFAITGYAPLAGAASHNGIHLFRWDSTIGHLRSVGRLPATVKPELLNYWGSGNLRAGFQGHLLYQVASPHEVFVFDSAGNLVGSRRVALDVSGPDDAFEVEESPTRFSIRRSRQQTIMPLGAEALSPTLWALERRITPDSTGGSLKEVIDVISSNGIRVAAWEVPDSLSPMGLIDGPASIRAFYGVALSEAGVRILVFEFRQ